ncbi:hypothetical protein N7516_011342 [Penicillium verrucosum]|uniref:uncharacterized protein n=1 Tax=Penicillium verrucosum TaxID=60171 RepID=UPI0025456FC5|nr:uncharacterized protein N7516_011342 [Penicillium verrucosum]KAJ5920484.1 hypothetical protein N7516_011342 [Penicillium verrucosum]
MSMRPQDVPEMTLDYQPENLPKNKKSKILPNESDEGSTAESSESEIDETQPKSHHQNAKRKDHVKHKGKGKRMSLDSEGEDSEDSEDSEVEDDESSLVNFNASSKTQRRNTKQKATKRNRHSRQNRHKKSSTSHAARKGRDSSFYTGNKPSSSRARYQNVDHNRGVKRGRKQNVYQDDSTEESADESSSAEMDAASSRTNHGKVKRKRLGDPNEVADSTSDNESDMEEEVKRRLTRACAKSASVKNKSQTANDKKLDKTKELADSPDKDLVRNALGGLTLGGDADAPKTDGRAPRGHAKSTHVKMPVKTKSQSGNRKKVDKTNELAESLDKDLVGGAMDGSTSEGDAPKTNGRATKTTKEKHDERAGSMHEENEESERDEADV